MHAGSRDKAGAGQEGQAAGANSRTHGQPRFSSHDVGRQVTGGNKTDFIYYYQDRQSLISGSISFCLEDCVAWREGNDLMILIYYLATFCNL
jgi:hypothetical protein